MGQSELEASAGRRGLKEAMAELGAINRKHLRPSVGQATLTRRLHSLVNASKRLYKLTSQQVKQCAFFGAISCVFRHFIRVALM